MLTHTCFLLMPDSQIILPVVERSVTIAGISTRELVMKDFATEPNEEKMRKAGHLMAQKLAGSLALVTCKEPLKSNLGLHLRQCFADYGLGEVCFLQDPTSCVGAKLWFMQIVPEQLVQLLVQD